MSNEEREKQDERVRQMQEITQKLRISLEVAETVEHQAKRIIEQHSSYPYEVRQGLERAMNIFND
tara:strand:+ start:4619 stop:4813 length:195 start_codon:yes stop_codon:yes gene_type:complete